jgi:hypothetical protein
LNSRINIIETDKESLSKELSLLQGSIQSLQTSNTALELSLRENEHNLSMARKSCEDLKNAMKDISARNEEDIELLKEQIHTLEDQAKYKEKLFQDSLKKAYYDNALVRSNSSETTSNEIKILREEISVIKEKLQESLNCEQKLLGELTVKQESELALKDEIDILQEALQDHMNNSKLYGSNGTSNISLNAIINRERGLEKKYNKDLELLDDFEFKIERQEKLGSSKQNGVIQNELQTISKNNFTDSIDTTPRKLKNDMVSRNQNGDSNSGKKSLDAMNGLNGINYDSPTKQIMNRRNETTKAIKKNYLFIEVGGFEIRIGVWNKETFSLDIWYVIHTYLFLLFIVTFIF